MAPKVLLLHGWGGSNSPHWQSWLAGELAKEYGCVSFLEFSDYNFPQLELWKKELMEHLQDFKPDIVVCHSLANILWFHLCHEQNIAPVKKLFLVAPPSLECAIKELASFFPVLPPKNLYAQATLLITSTNDPYMSETEAKELQDSLQVPMQVIKNGGHINSASGYGTWAWMLEKIK